jgi:hypothetical protein
MDHISMLIGKDKKLKKLCVGKNLEDFRLRKLAKEIKLRPRQLIKLKFIQQEGDNVLAKQYLQKLRKEEVSIDWARFPNNSMDLNAKD